jgi:hypothetical protein
MARRAVISKVIVLLAQDIQYEVLAITEDQITEYDLPTRPEKTDASREAAKLDAMPPQILRDLINDAIKRHIDHDAFKQLRVAEMSERTIMKRTRTTFLQFRFFSPTPADKHLGRKRPHQPRRTFTRAADRANRRCVRTTPGAGTRALSAV